MHVPNKMVDIFQKTFFHGNMFNLISIFSECRERFPSHRGLAIPTCITAHAWRTCRGKRSRRMCNLRFCVSCKRPIEISTWRQKSLQRRNLGLLNSQRPPSCLLTLAGSDDDGSSRKRSMLVFHFSQREIFGWRYRFINCSVRRAALSNRASAPCCSSYSYQLKDNKR